jgi:hypothetical protein
VVPQQRPGRSIRSLAKSVSPGHYQIEEFSLDPETGKRESWEWGTLKKERMLELKRPPNTLIEFMHILIVPRLRQATEQWQSSTS